MDDRLTSARTRDAVALIMAALREDTTAMAHLLETVTTVKQGRDLATFCALYAAQKSRELERTLPGLDIESTLRDVALHLART
jgi:hypothetical protein